MQLSQSEPDARYSRKEGAPAVGEQGLAGFHRRLMGGT